MAWQDIQPILLALVVGVLVLFVSRYVPRVVLAVLLLVLLAWMWTYGLTAPSATTEHVTAAILMTYLALVAWVMSCFPPPR